MRKYHHYGIPTEEKRPDESYVEGGEYKFYTTPFDANKWHIQWHRFPQDHGLPEIVTKVPHIGLQVDNLDEELIGCKVLFGPYEPLKGYRVAMVEEEGVLIELIETFLTDEELTKLERAKLDQSSEPKTQ